MILHYSGAAKRAGQSYVGALLCTPDGLWPESAKTPDSDEYKRIAAGFKRCDLELWELFGGSTKQSYMWSTDYTSWADSNNPPPLDPIGDIPIAAWQGSYCIIIIVIILPAVVPVSYHFDVSLSNCFLLFYK